MFENLWRAIKAVNKKVWVTLAFVAVFFAIGTTWIIVANATAAFKPVSMAGLSPEQRQNVSGNGGPAVMVGDWLYFVGNYVDTSTIKYRQNEHNNVTYGAIYRVWIDPVANAETGGLLYENGENVLTTPGYQPHLLDKSKFNLVVPKVTGFDQAALWIFDRHLIYTSPNNTKDKYGDLQLGKIDFFRVDLDGRNHRKIYTTVNEMVTTDDFTVACYGQDVYVLIKDGEMLRRISVTKDPGQVKTVSDKVESVALPKVTEYRGGADGVINLSESYRGVMSYVYYTEELTEDQQRDFVGNTAIQYDVRGDKKIEARNDGYRFDILALSGGRLAYTVTSVSSGERLGLYSYSTNQIEDKKSPFEYFDNYQLLEGWALDSSEVVHLPTVLAPSVDFRYVTLAGNSLYIYQEGGQEPKAMVSGVSKIIMITASTIHYLSSGGEFKAVNLNNGEADPWLKSTVSPETAIRPWVVSRNTMTRYFYIKSMEEIHDDHDDHGEEGHEHGSMTIAVLVDLTGEKACEYILGRIGCEYIAGHENCQ